MEVDVVVDGAEDVVGVFGLRGRVEEEAFQEGDGQFSLVAIIILAVCRRYYPFLSL